MRQKRQPAYRPPALADGWYWLRVWVPLRTGGYNYEWRIARVEGGKVKPFGMTDFLEPNHRYLRHALWHGPIEPPALGDLAGTNLALARSGIRQKRKKRQGGPSNETPQRDRVLLVARQIADAFIQSSDDLRAVYADTPEKLEEVVRQVAALIEKSVR